MPYERVWIPDLQQWKIIGEITGEEALSLQQSIPFGMTQWGWNAASGGFAYGTVTDSRKFAYSEPTPLASPILIQRSKEYIPPDIPDEYKHYWSSVGTTPVNGQTDNSDNLVLVGVSILLLTSILGGLKNGKEKARSKQTS